MILNSCFMIFVLIEFINSYFSMYHSKDFIDWQCRNIMYTYNKMLLILSSFCFPVSLAQVLLDHSPQLS